jgi:hypothetical protein
LDELGREEDFEEKGMRGRVREAKEEKNGECYLQIQTHNEGK